MNYLAHLFLSGNDESIILGNFIADAIRNKAVPNYSAAVQNGILLHRKIDYFTDNHSEVLRATRRLYSYHGKYAPVVIDVFFDNLLANNWERYTSEPLAIFAERMYEILQRRQDDLPLKMQKYVPSMIANDWLQKYGTTEGLQYTFERMDLRAEFPSNFKNAVKYLQKDYDFYNEVFQLFFPEVMQLSAAFLEEYAAGNDTSVV